MKLARKARTVNRAIRGLMVRKAQEMAKRLRAMERLRVMGRLQAVGRLRAAERLQGAETLRAVGRLQAVEPLRPRKSPRKSSSQARLHMIGCRRWSGGRI